MFKQFLTATDRLANSGFALAVFAAFTGLVA